MVRLVQIEVGLEQECIILDWMLHRQPFVLAPGGLDKVDQRQSLTVRAGINQRLVGRNDWRRDRARSTNRIAEVSSRQVLANAFERREEKGFVPANGPADCAAKLLAAKVLERLAV